MVTRGTRLPLGARLFWLAVPGRLGRGREQQGTPRREAKETLVAGTDRSRWIADSFAASPDGRHIAYVVRALVGGLLVAIDGRPGAGYEAVVTPIFSPDSKRVAYEAVQRDKRFVVLDGKEGKKHEGLVRGSSVVFDSPVGLHYLARKGNGIYLTDERIERGPAGRRRDLLRCYKPLIGE